MPLYSIVYPTKKVIVKKSLPESTERMKGKILNPIIFSNKGAPRRTRLAKANFLGGSSHIDLTGAFTLEAAIIMPLLACFFVCILFFFRVMQVELEVQKALDDTARELAVYLALGETGQAMQVEETMQIGWKGQGQQVRQGGLVGETRQEGQTGAVGEMAEFVAARVLFSSKLAKRDIATAYVKGGSLGVSLRDSVFTEDEVRLRAVYKISLPVRLFWIKEIRVEQRADCRKWTGDSGEGMDGDIEETRWVYVTQTGEVYHLSKECPSLKITVQETEYSQIPQLRNENGEKYRCCNLCEVDYLKNSTVYITNQGNHYHSSLECSGIKRSIFIIRLSEVEGKRVCRKCGVK